MRIENQSLKNELAAVKQEVALRLEEKATAALGKVTADK